MKPKYLMTSLGFYVKHNCYVKGAVAKLGSTFPNTLAIYFSLKHLVTLSSIYLHTLLTHYCPSYQPFSLSLFLFINSSDPCTRLSLSFLLSFFLFISLLLPSLFLRSTPSERVRAGVNTDTSRYRVGQTFQPTK